MGTEVLRPQDVLSDRFHGPPAAAFHRRRHFPAAGNLTTLIATGARKPNTNFRKPDKKKPTNSGEPRRRDDGAAAPTVSMGQVTLLRRGESLDSLNKKQKPKPIGKPADDLAALGTARIGPEMAPKRIFSSPPPPQPSKMYAGSAFSNSPSPQSLPVPSFFSNKKQQFDDSATRDLRRLLRLE